MKVVKAENGHKSANGHEKSAPDNIRKRSFSEHNRSYSADGSVKNKF